MQPRWGAGTSRPRSVVAGRPPPLGRAKPRKTPSAQKTRRTLKASSTAQPAPGSLDGAAPRARKPLAPRTRLQLLDAVELPAQNRRPNPAPPDGAGQSAPRPPALKRPRGTRAPQGPDAGRPRPRDTRPPPGAGPHPPPEQAGPRRAPSAPKPRRTLRASSTAQPAPGSLDGAAPRARKPLAPRTRLQLLDAVELPAQNRRPNPAPPDGAGQSAPRPPALKQPRGTGAPRGPDAGRPRLKDTKPPPGAGPHPPPERTGPRRAPSAQKPRRAPPAPRPGPAPHDADEPPWHKPRRPNPAPPDGAGPQVRKRLAPRPRPQPDDAGQGTRRPPRAPHRLIAQPRPALRPLRRVMPMPFRRGPASRPQRPDQVPLTPAGVPGAAGGPSPPESRALSAVRPQPPVGHGGVSPRHLREPATRLLPRPRISWSCRIFRRSRIQVGRPYYPHSQGPRPRPPRPPRPRPLRHRRPRP